MHSSMMCTACSLTVSHVSREGGSAQLPIPDADSLPPGCRPPPPWMQTPSSLDADPSHWMQTPPPWMQTPSSLDADPSHWMQTPPTGCRPLPPGCRPHPSQCMLGSQPPLPSACWEANPLFPVHAGKPTPLPSACWEANPHCGQKE